MPKISVIIPVYNVEKYISECVNSVYVQSYLDIEVIFVDDCGEDDSISYVKSFITSKQWKNAVIVSHECNKGLAAARNTGLKYAKGEYVLFLDSDDSLTTDALVTLSEPLKYSQYDYIFGAYSGKGNTSELMLDGPIHGEQVPISYLDGHQYVMAWNKLYSRDFLLNNDIWFDEGLLHEDVSWTFKLVTCAKSIYSIPEITYHYRVRPNSIMTSLTIEKDVRSYIEVFRSISIFASHHLIEVTSPIYEIFEGKRSGILYSLLNVRNLTLYREAYASFRRNMLLPIIKARNCGVINIKTYLRDVHYVMPISIGLAYKRIFYILYYKIGKHNIGGLLWQ